MVGYFNNVLIPLNLNIPQWAAASPFEGGILNLPAFIITLLMAGLLIRGTKESVVLNTIIVIVKLSVIFLFLVVGFGHIDAGNWSPFAPFGFSGILAGASIIFFAFIGFDAVSTAAEEVKKTQRDLPIGIIASLFISTILYIAVTAVLTGMVEYPRLNTATPILTSLLLVGVSKIHPKFGTPYRITAVVGVGVSLLAAFLPIGVIAEMANIGT
jgi:APA family basic amino acid/polyamine antiporter